MNQTLLDQDLSQELAKVNITEALITSLKEEASVILAEKPTSVAQYKLVEGIRKKAKYMRLGGEKLFDHEIAERHKAHKDAIRRKNEVLAPIADVEMLAKKLSEEWEHEQEMEAQRIREAREKEINDRVISIQELGYMLKDGVWGMEGVYVDDADVRSSGAEKWGNLVRSLRMHAEAIVAARAEEKRKQEEEAERIKREQKELEEQKARLQRQQDEMNAKLNEARKNELLALGCTTYQGRIGVVQGILETFGLVENELHLINPNDWLDHVTLAQMAIKAREEGIKQAQEAAARQALINERVEKLKAAGWYDELPSDDGTPQIALHDGSAQVVFMLPTLADLEDGVIGHYVALGHAELARRKEAEAEAIRQQERDRIERDRVAAEQLANQQQAERLAKDGDIERIRQAILIITSAGSKIGELTVTAQSDMGKESLEAVRQTLLSAHRILTSAQDAIRP